MRKLFGWMAGLVGIAALARVLAQRSARHHAPPALPRATGPDPAEALRRKLSETREAAATDQAAVPAEPDETLEERRSRVHAKAQEAIRAMQDTPG